MTARDRRLGSLSALPLGLLLAGGFVAPLLVISGFSIMPQRVFDLAHIPDFSAYVLFFKQGYYKSLLWSLAMAFTPTVILFVLCWPLAYGMAKVFGRFGLFLTVAVAVTLLVSENIRLFGWVVTLMKGGLIDGYLNALTGWRLEGALYNVPVTIFGLV